MLIESKENGITEKLLGEEQGLKREISRLESSVGSLVRNSNLLQIIDTVIQDEDFISDSVLIKSFYKLIITSPEEVIIVISNSSTTEHLVNSIDDLKTLPSLLSKMHIDYELKKGIRYRVIFYA